MKLVAMNDHEELLAKACGCLGEASKIQEPEVRAKELDLVYHSQRLPRQPLPPTSMEAGQITKRRLMARL